MTREMRRVKRKIDEAYEHIKPYIEEPADEEEFEELKELCLNCKEYTEAEHNYEKCRNKTCFKLWLCFVYLSWETSWEEY